MSSFYLFGYDLFTHVQCKYGLLFMACSKFIKVIQNLCKVYDSFIYLCTHTLIVSKNSLIIYYYVVQMI